MSPTGTGVTWWEANGDASVRTSDEGIYAATIPSSGCPAPKTLIAAGGSYPFWGSAAVDAAVPPNTAPVVTITAKPGTFSRSTAASISYAVKDTTDFSVTTTCTLDGKAISCGSPKTLSALAQGKHSLLVTAKDPEGATGSASASWTVDTGLPAFTVAIPAAATVGSSVVFLWSGKDSVSGIAGYDIQSTYASYQGSFAAWTTKATSTTATSYTVSGLKPGFEYCVRIRARDKAGNVSAYSPARCTTHPMDDRSLTASAGWTRPSVTSAYAHTETQSTHSGASLTLASARVANRVGVLATVTTTGGSVAVYVGSTKIGTLSLKASAAHYQTPLWLTVSSAKTGTLSIKMLSASQVRIDGLLSLRTP
jgi:hypothetical protein